MKIKKFISISSELKGFASDLYNISLGLFLAKSSPLLIIISNKKFLKVT